MTCHLLVTTLLHLQPHRHTHTEIQTQRRADIHTQVDLHTHSHTDTNPLSLSLNEHVVKNVKMSERSTHLHSYEIISKGIEISSDRVMALRCSLVCLKINEDYVKLT